MKKGNGIMSESVRLKEIRVRQEIYRELLKQTPASPEGADSDGVEALEWDGTALEVREFGANE